MSTGHNGQKKAADLIGKRADSKDDRIFGGDDGNHLDHADSLLDQIDTLTGEKPFEAMNAGERAFDFLYNLDPASQTYLIELLKLAGGFRPGIEAAIVETVQMANGFTLKGKEKTDFFIALKIELNKVGEGLYAHGAKRLDRAHSRPEEGEKLRGREERAFVQNERNRPNKKTWNPLKEDGKTRMDMADALIRFADRKRKGMLQMDHVKTNPTPEREQNTWDKLVQVEEKPYLRDLALLNERDKDLSYITHTMNAKGSGNEVEAARKAFEKIGVNVPGGNQEGLTDFEQAIRKIFNIPKGETLARFMNREHPDFGEKIREKDLPAICKKCTPMLSKILISFFKENKGKEIPTRLTWAFIDAYKILESHEIGKGMKKYVGLDEFTIEGQRKIIIETGVQALEQGISWINKKNEPPPFQQIVDILIRAKEDHPDLILAEHDYKSMSAVAHIA